MWWVLPSLVWVLVSSSGQPPRNLAEAAARAAMLRHLAPPVVPGLTDRDVPRATAPEPPPTPPATAQSATTAADPNAPVPAGSVPPVPPAADHGETWWRERMATARATLDRDQLLSNGLQSRLNALATDIVSRDDPAQRAQLIEEQQRTQLEWERLRKQVNADRDAIAAIEEDARVQGIPPGWIR